VKISGIDAAFIAFQTENAVVVFLADYGDGGTAKVALDTRRLGLPADFTAVNREDPEQKFRAADGAFTVPDMKKHDFLMLTIEKTGPPAPKPLEEP